MSKVNWRKAASPSHANLCMVPIVTIGWQMFSRVKTSKVPIHTGDLNPHLIYTKFLRSYTPVCSQIPQLSCWLLDRFKASFYTAHLALSVFGIKAVYTKHRHRPRYLRQVQERAASNALRAGDAAQNVNTLRRFVLKLESHLGLLSVTALVLPVNGRTPERYNSHAFVEWSWWAVITAGSRVPAAGSRDPSVHVSCRLCRLYTSFSGSPRVASGPYIRQFCANNS